MSDIVVVEDLYCSGCGVHAEKVAHRPLPVAVPARLARKLTLLHHCPEAAMLIATAPLTTRTPYRDDFVFQMPVTNEA